MKFKNPPLPNNNALIFQPSDLVPSHVLLHKNAKEEKRWIFVCGKWSSMQQGIVSIKMSLKFPSKQHNFQHKSYIKTIFSQKGLFSLMLARLDEFDSLTPLISTPSASNASDSLITQQVALKFNQSSAHWRTLAPTPQKYRTKFVGFPSPTKKTFVGDSHCPAKLFQVC